MTLDVVGHIYDRTDWGAPATPGGTQRDRSLVVGMTVHHTTGNTLGHDDTVRWWHNIWRWHTGNNGWADIGYGYGIDRFGNLFVGRGRYRQLAHARGYNTDWLGVAYLGSGIQGHVTDDAKQTFVSLRNWLREDGGMDNMSRLNGHRDIGSTSCPGDVLYRWVSDGMTLPEPDPEPEDDMAKYARIPDHKHRHAIYELVGDTFYHVVNPAQRDIHEKLLGRKIDPVELTVDEVKDAGFRIQDGHTAL